MKPHVTPLAGERDASRTGEQEPPKPRRGRIQDLLGGSREVNIEHRNEEYRLRMTSNSKLILTK